MGYDMSVNGHQLPRPGQVDRDYLRRSIWGQGPLRDMLVTIGAAYGDYDYEVVFPEYDPAWDDLPESELPAEYSDALAAARIWAPEERTGIPLHKLGDNSGWHVTRQESLEALLATLDHIGLGVPADTPAEVVAQIAESALAEGQMASLAEQFPQVLEVDDPDEGFDVIEFLITAARSNGFNVY